MFFHVSATCLLSVPACLLIHLPVSSILCSLLFNAASLHLPDCVSLLGSLFLWTPAVTVQSEHNWSSRELIFWLAAEEPPAWNWGTQLCHWSFTGSPQTLVWWRFMPSLTWWPQHQQCSLPPYPFPASQLATLVHISHPSWLASVLWDSRFFCWEVTMGRSP